MFENQNVCERDKVILMTIVKVIPTEEVFNVYQMSESQLHAKLQRGYDDYKEGRVQNAADAFARFMRVNMSDRYN